MEDLSDHTRNMVDAQIDRMGNLLEKMQRVRTPGLGFGGPRGALTGTITDQAGQPVGQVAIGERFLRRVEELKEDVLVGAGNDAD